MNEIWRKNESGVAWVRFTRKFWEFYLSYIFRGKELQFEFEVVKRSSSG
jgi:hypothetical protein